MSVWLPTIPIVLFFSLIVGIIYYYGEDVKWLKPIWNFLFTYKKDKNKDETVKK